MTTGFDTMIIDGDMADDFSSFKGVVEFEKDACGREVAIVVCMSEKHEYKALLNGKPVEIISPFKGMMYISLPASAKSAKLEIVPVTK